MDTNSATKDTSASEEDAVSRVSLHNHQESCEAEGELQAQARQTNELSSRDQQSSRRPVQTPSERLLIKMSVHNSNVNASDADGVVGEVEAVEQLSAEDRLPPSNATSSRNKTTAKNNVSASDGSLEKAGSEKQRAGHEFSAHKDGVYDEKVWYALGVTVAQRLLHLKKLTRSMAANDDNTCRNEEWGHIVSGIVDTLRTSNADEEEKKSEIADIYQDDVRRLVQTRMKQPQQHVASAAEAAAGGGNGASPHPSDASFGVFGSAISTISSLQSVQEGNKYEGDSGKHEKKTDDGKLRREAYVAAATAAGDDEGDIKAEKAKVATNQITAGQEGSDDRSDDILRLLLYPNASTASVTSNRPNSPLTRDASNATNNTTSTSTPGAFRVQSMAHGPSTVERATAGDSASREHNYSYTNRSGMAESFSKGQDICVEAVACDDGDDIEQQQVVVIAKEVTIWSQLRQPKILAVIGCLMLVVVAIAVPITMKADSAKAPAEDVEAIIAEDEDRDEDMVGGDMPIPTCNFTEQYRKVIGKGLEDYGLSISTSGKDAIKWLADRMSYLNSPSDQDIFCDTKKADQSLLQLYSLASIFYSSSPQKQEAEESSARIPFCDKEQGDIGWPTSFDADENVCEWEGVSCAANTTAVVSLDLSRRGWKGDIPADEFVILKDSLSYLDLSHNEYSDTLPSSLGLLENLFYLDVSANSLTGTIPIALSNLAVAYEIYLDNNSWNSTAVPAEVCNLKDTGILTILAVGEDCACCSSCPSLSLYSPDWI